jgi:hypothetical protein
VIFSSPVKRGGAIFITGVKTENNVLTPLAQGGASE